MVAIGSATFPPVLNCRISTHTPTGTAHSGLRYCQYIKGTSGYEIAFFGIRLFEKPKKIELKQILIYWFVHIDSTATTEHRLSSFNFVVSPWWTIFSYQLHLTYPGKLTWFLTVYSKAAPLHHCKNQANLVRKLDILDL